MTPHRTVLAIGTRKGLWLATSDDDRRSWQLSAPHHLAQEVPSVAVDTRGGRTRVLAGLRSEHWGSTVVHSDDLGASWVEPGSGAIRFGPDDEAAVERVWSIRPDTAARLREELALLRREAALVRALPSLPAVDLARTPSSAN